MSKFGGYAGNILFVDLTTKKTEKRPLLEDMVRNFIGNRGMNAKLAYDLVDPGIDPFSPENALIFGTGPFLGTMVPTAGRSDLTFKSPLTGLIANDSSGNFGMIKFAGYDYLVITGKADGPVYLRIYDDDVAICDATKIWGKDVWESTDILEKNLGGDYAVTVIGPAGENLYRDSCIVNQKFGFHAQSGSGAVMGSKNLKAIAVKGTKSIAVSEPNRFKELVDKLFYEIVTNTEWVVPGTMLGSFEEWQKLGTLTGIPDLRELNMAPYKNFQGAAPYEAIKGFDNNIFLNRIKEGDIACMACPIGSKHILKIRDGKYKGLSLAASCVGLIVWSWGIYTAITEYDELIKCAELCARYGMDVLSTAANIAFAIELYERGIISKADTGGLVLKWGSAEAIQDLIRKIAFREDIGDVLANGLREACRRIGKDSWSYAVQIRGLPTVLDTRSVFVPETFGQHTAIRGGHSQLWHCGPLALLKPDKIKKFAMNIGIAEDAMGRILGGPIGYNVARFTKWNEDFQDLLNLLGLCNHPFLTIRHNIELLSELYSALTGIEISPKEIRNCAERGWNMQKAFNVREGASRKNDLPPRRFITEVFNVKGFGGKGEDQKPLNKEEFNKHLDEYYEERGWDVKQGIPSRQKLEELGLEHVLKDI